MEGYGPKTQRAAGEKKLGLQERAVLREYQEALEDGNYRYALGIYTNPDNADLMAEFTKILKAFPGSHQYIK